jgi:SAM-dependent methyltransferase
LLNPRETVFKLVDRRRYRWTNDGSLQKRRYEDYAEYVHHQKQKLESRPSEWLLDHERRYPALLAERIAQVAVVHHGMTVLCLGARLGAEVRAFLTLGCFAVGIDLNPGVANKFVLCGDFHDIQFPDATVDILFCNALDHAFDVPRMMTESRRVLKPEGRLVLEIVSGKREGYVPGHFEATIWETIEDAVQLVCRSGFSVVNRRQIDDPWRGEIISFKPAA